MVFLITLCGYRGFAFSTVNTEDCATITLTSSSGTLFQTVCLNTLIIPVVCSLGNGATGASVSGLPAGVEFVYDDIQGVVTISGAPTQSGTFVFVITTIGGECPATLNGTMVINPNSRIRLGFASDSANPTYCVGSSINNLVYNISNGATGAFISSGGLPPGVNATLTNNQFKIMGNPSVIGAFPYSVTTIGGCSSETLSGVINVVNEATFQMISEPELLTQSICPGYIEPILFRANDNEMVELIQGSQFLNLNRIQGIYTLRSQSILEPGIYPFQVAIQNGFCGNASLTGTIEVKPRPQFMVYNSYYTDDTYTTLVEDWYDVVDATSYEYSYSIDNGPIVNGSTLPPVSELHITGLLPGQTVHFEYHPVGPFCYASMAGSNTSPSLQVDNFKDDVFEFYPNPVEGLLNIAAKSKIFKVVVFNLLGQEVFEDYTDSSEFQIDMSGFSSGIYMVKLISDASAMTFKITKN